jgi:hypothetical protein
MSMPGDQLDGIIPTDEAEGLVEDGPQNDTEEVTEPSFDPLAFLAEYSESKDRTELWETLTDEQQGQLQALGVTGPLNANEEGFELDPALDMNRASAELRLALAQVRRGDIDADDETRDRIEQLARQADIRPNDRDAVQRALFVLNGLKRSAFELRPFRPDEINSRYDQRRGAYITVERDSITGREREVSSATAEEIEDSRSVDETTVDPATVRLDDVADWPADRWARFADEHPDHAERLRRAYSERQNERQQSARERAGIF